MRKCTKSEALTTLTVDQAVGPVYRADILNTLAPRFFTYFLWFFMGCADSVAHKCFLMPLQQFKGFRLIFWDLRLRFWDGSSFNACHSQFQLYSRMPRAFVWVGFLLVVLSSFSTSLAPFFFDFLMAPRR